METEPFKDTFGPKAQRKKPRIDAGDFEELSKFGAAAEKVADAAATESGANVIGSFVSILFSVLHLTCISFARASGILIDRATDSCRLQ